MSNPIIGLSGSMSLGFSAQAPAGGVLTGKYNIPAALNLSLPFQQMAANNLPTVAANQALEANDSIAASATDNIDLSTGLNQAGLIGSFASLSLLILYLPSITGSMGKSLNLAAQASSVTIGDAASNAWDAVLGATGTITLKPGQFVILGDESGVNQFPVDGTHKTLKVLNNDGVNAASLLLYMVGKDA